MEFEQLHLKTVELLAARCSEWGLPSENDEPDATEETDTNGSHEDIPVLSCLRSVHEQELNVIERGQSAQVLALRGNIRRMRELEERMDQCQQTMSELRESYETVTSRTSSLHDACDRAMAQQTALAAGAEQIRSNLHYFNQADSIMKKLKSGAKLAPTGQTFTSILASIDECLTYLRQQPEYKESDVYIAKYEQCLSKAMTTIRCGVLADLEASARDVRQRQAHLTGDYEKTGRQIYADDDTFALLYGVFAARANSVKSALSVAESRFQNVPDFEEMLAECQNAYFQIRVQLLMPIIESTLLHISQSNAGSTCVLTRTACSFLLRVCDDEFTLFRQFFNVDNGQEEQFTPSRRSAPSVISSAPPTSHPFDSFSESLCRLLYDMLRPLIVHNPHLETLTELCTILKVEMLDERCGAIPFDHVTVDPRAGFVSVMGELVGDVAERIVYRASLYGQSDIAGYNPAAGDLAYPQKLEMMKKIEEEKQKENEENKSNGEEQKEGQDRSSISAVDLHCLWYPTVRRTVVCLSKLFKCLDMAVFESLSRDLLSMCCQSLDDAANHIAARGKDGVLHAHLFVVKHLLILREQTAPYRTAAASRPDCTLSTRDYSIDFSRLRDSASQLLAEKSTNAFLEFIFSVSAPINVHEVHGDSRRVIDVSLRTRCNQMIASASDLIVSDLVKFADIAEDKSMSEGFELSKHPDLKADKVKDVVADSYKRLNGRWKEIRALFSLYIGVPETESILLQPIKKRIVDTFVRVSSFVSKWLSEEEQQIVAMPSQQHVFLVLNA